MSRAKLISCARREAAHRKTMAAAARVGSEESGRMLSLFYTGSVCETLNLSCEPLQEARSGGRGGDAVPLAPADQHVNRPNARPIDARRALLEGMPKTRDRFGAQAGGAAR